jgi:hypothetical protein
MPDRSNRNVVKLLENSAASGLALALAVTPRFVVPCAHQIQTAAGASVPMRCHWTFQTEFLLALATLIVTVGLWAVRNPEARRAAGSALALFGLLVVAVSQSWVIGLCGNPAMPCHATAHWLWFWAALLVIDGVLIAVPAGFSSDSPALPDPWENPKGANRAAVDP